MHLYKASDWGEGSHWYVNDISDVKSNGIYWWTQMRILGLTPTDFIHTLKDKYKVNKCSYNKTTNVLVFSFKTQADARKYKNYLNKIAREKQYMV